jgi:hypothetical protein
MVFAFAVSKLSTLPFDTAFVFAMIVAVVMAWLGWNRLDAVLGFGVDGERVPYLRTSGGGLRAIALLVFAAAFLLWSYLHYA